MRQADLSIGAGGVMSWERCCLGLPTVTIGIAENQADVAELAGSSRESASRFLAVLERAGVVTQGRGRITVHDPEALERYVY